jgi:hypothetical protein
MLTDAQVRLLRRKLMEGKKQEAAAAAAGISVRSARTWKDGPLPSASKKPRDWRTREDPFDKVWDDDIVPLLEADEKAALRAPTLMDILEEKYPGSFKPGQVRTLQRRLREWRALKGPDKEVFFEQDYKPGEMASFDFTHCNELEVTIQGEPFPHLLFVLALAYSGWTWICLAFGETFEALVKGLQGALWALGGVPKVVRHDNLSAATHELKLSGGRALNKRFKAVLDHYDLRSSRITPHEANENGVAEQANHRVKSAIAQALVVRGSSDFSSIEDYVAFAEGVVERSRNRRTHGKLAEEKTHLMPLPSAPIPSYTTFHPKVRRWSTIQVAKRIYSVPSRLIGHTVEVHQHPDHLEVFYRGRLIERMPRMRGEKDHHIDYRHVIWSLVRKPGAFAHYRYREDLFPSLTFRRAYDAICQFRGVRADVEYVRILHLAASTMESTVETALVDLLEQGHVFDYAVVRKLACPETPTVPQVRIPEPDLLGYDELLAGGDA